MIKMSQVKLPVEKVYKLSDNEHMYHGALTQSEKEAVKSAAAKLLRINVNDIKDFKIEKKSIDARKKDRISYIYQVVFEYSNEQQAVKRYGKNDVRIIEDKKIIPHVNTGGRTLTDRKVVVVGMGPAGLFAALSLARKGITTIVIERGSDVEKRRQRVETFWNGGNLNTECNVQFGEGGAGTFSDGKLNTLVKDPFGYGKRVMQTFVEFGAPSEIMYLQKPHIGTDKLRGVVKAIREEIIRLGGTVCFDTKLTDIHIKENKLESVSVVKSGEQTEKIIECDRLILATGHSARDTFYMLRDRGVVMQQKPFAVGVRVEHEQKMIGINQYGDWYDKLPAADYKLTHTTEAGRGVYSFCMCPGGYVVNASSEAGRLAVNGMSNYERNSNNANSAIVVTISPEDFGSEDVLAGIEFQRKWEKEAYRQANGKIPVQLLADFWQNRVSTGFGKIVPEMKGEYAFANVREILPKIVGDSIAEGMIAFGKKIHGYSAEDTVLSGIESRTSSPVRIGRDEQFQCNVKGIYPCGEGAGYAGGITSAAIDGIKVAENILCELNNL